MCGLIGIFAWDGRVDIDPRHVSLLRHRGPDDGAVWQDGSFFFGHRRLSIIDIATGQQPMGTADGSLVVIFNGEIYNYIELRKELEALGHQFQSHSDTEILLHGYRAWGRDMPVRLKGMFAFAIADREKQEIFLARDRFGEKPLFYAEILNGVAFASELGALSALPQIPLTIDDEALGEYLCLNYVTGDRTMLSAIRRLAPGSWRAYGVGGQMETGVFWSLRDSIADVRSVMNRDEALERLDDLLGKSVEFALRSDVPVGIFLSGGIDSSLIAHAAASRGKLTQAFCLSIPGQGFDELDAATRTAKRLGIPITGVAFGPESLEGFLELVEHADDPLADSSALAVATLAREASKTIKVVLGGDGGDELFGGYLTYKATLLHQRWVSPLPMVIRRGLAKFAHSIPTSEAKVSGSYALYRFLRASDITSGEAHFSWNGTWLPEYASHLPRSIRAMEASRTALSRLANSLGVVGTVDLRSLQLADILGYLPNDILVKSDRMTMAHGLEIRSPFLDSDLAIFALSLPAFLKAGMRGPLKRILRELAARTCGSDCARAKKQGFSIPVHTWLRERSRDLVEDLLSERSLIACGLLEVRVVRQAVEAHMAGRKSYGFELWGLMVLVAWHRCRVLSRPYIPLNEPMPKRIIIPLVLAGQR